jgi:hypothetical protein
MLKTNSKKAAENIRAYIVDGFTPEGYTDNPPQDFPNIAAFILDTFRSEKYWCLQDVRYYHGSEAAAFADWCAGLPSVLDTCYFYNRSAVDDLGAILEETETEKARYTEQQAEQLLTSLIYRELLKGAKTK